ncbi:hypothetical protein A3D11_02525 [Candidatus Peribacteria bacterium RIFCSPHIGHO2_02_FULL_49_16]|nr:MAG: hypothetical protein A2880_02035 [Candidatus Peribacteria bacterium RIFCSPHIGHO2_01_FULL_49_38]OGJ58473.1 MAG: hypothetical protein A3D11_02525 [Candidatus Peribacteria bacterium RIFCSPHIGHO2_02_FULL_49_16]
MLKTQKHLSTVIVSLVLCMAYFAGFSSVMAQQRAPDGQGGQGGVAPVEGGTFGDPCEGKNQGTCQKGLECDSKNKEKQICCRAKGGCGRDSDCCTGLSCNLLTGLCQECLFIGKQLIENPPIQCGGQTKCCVSEEVACSDGSRPSPPAPKAGLCCKRNGVGCTNSGECCSGECNEKTNTCSEIPACIELGKSCDPQKSDKRCCGEQDGVEPHLVLVCSGANNGTCCRQKGTACGFDGNCCSDAPFCIEGFCAAALLPSAPASGLPSTDIVLLRPFGGARTVSKNTGVQVLIDYLDAIWPWLIAMGVGVAVVRTIIAGYELMLSGGNPGLRQQAMQHILYSIVGILMLIFAAVILSLINPNAYAMLLPLLPF